MRRYNIKVIKSFTDLEVYKRSQALYPDVVKFSGTFSREGWHLRDQICRAANAIHADIAEGFGRSVPEFKMYLTRALGSCNELISHLNDALNVGFGEEEMCKKLLLEYDIVGKQLYRLRQFWR